MINDNNDKQGSNQIKITFLKEKEFRNSWEKSLEMSNQGHFHVGGQQLHHFQML